MEKSRLEKINIVNQEHLIEILQNDISTNYSIGLHTSIDDIGVWDDNRINGKIGLHFFEGYWNINNYSSLHNFITPFADVLNIKNKKLKELYGYNYWNKEGYLNFVFTFPKFVKLNNIEYFLGNFNNGGNQNILTDYLFDSKNVPCDFIYGALLKKSNSQFQLIKNPNHLRLKSDKEKDRFYSSWLKDDQEILEAIHNENVEVDDGCGGWLILDTIVEKYKVMEKK